MAKGHKDKISVNIWLEPEVIEILDRLAAKAEIPRSRLMKNLVVVSAQELQSMDKLGLWQFSCILRDMAKTLRDWVQDCKSDPDLFGVHNEHDKEWEKQCNGGEGCKMPCASS